MAHVRTLKLPLTVTATFAILAAACGSSAPDAASESATSPLTEQVSIPNAGTTDVEGHTPQGFAGSGVGLFVGDNLNSNFPDGDGVQLFLTFSLAELGEAAPDSISSATVTSDALSLSGTPFADLGTLRLAPVSYEAFSPAVFDLEPIGDANECVRQGEASLNCDATAAVSQALADGADRVQFRMRFDTPGDGDRSQDLATFFLTDSNTNEPGIFSLDID